MRPEIAVDPLRRCVPLTGRAVGEQCLQAIDDLDGRPLLDRRRGRLRRRSRPRRRSNEGSTVESRALLNCLTASRVAARRRRRRSARDGRSQQRALQSLHRIAGGA